MPEQGKGKKPEPQSLRNYWFDGGTSIQRREKHLTTNRLPGFTPHTPSLWDTDMLQPTTTISEQTAETHAAKAPAITTLPVDPDIVIPNDLLPLVTHVPRYLMPEEQQKKSVMHLISTRFFILGYDQGQRRHQIAGIILESDDGTDRQPMLYHGVPHLFDRAIQQIREVALMQGYLQKDGTLNVNALETATLPTVSTDTTQEAAQMTEERTNPLLTVLSEDEIFIDPFEVPADEAQEQGFPLLRRDVKSFRWWLEFGYDTRDDPELYEALKAHNWKWGGYRQQWFNPNPYARIPEGLYYGNAGPCFYSEERAERLEARQVRASTKATEHQERADRMASVIPLGQPMMPDHHSYKSDLSYRKKIWKQMDQFVEYYKKAEWLGDRAESSRRHQAWKESVFAMKNRLDRLEADVRSMRRRYQDDIRDGDSQDLDHWRRCMTILATEIVPLRQAIDAAGGLPIEKIEQELKPGDYIKIAGRPQYVVKVNKTTITCAHPTLKLHSGKPWETKYKKTDFQELLATAEEIKERKQKEEGE